MSHFHHDPSRFFTGKLAGFLCLLTLVAAAAHAVPTPMSSQLTVAPQGAVERLVMEPVDVETLRAEDLVRDSATMPSAPRFAAPIKVAYTLDRGTWETLADGSRLWRARIHSPGALSLNLGFGRFEIAEGVQMWLYPADGSSVAGPFTWRHRADDGQFWSPILLGDEIVVELFVPAAARQPSLEIAYVNHGYRFFGEKPNKQGDCNIDTICPEADPYRDQVRAVGRYTISGFRLCTGTLLNNTAGDFRPFFLTAQHCGVDAGNESSVVVYWNYESPTCGALSGGSLDDFQMGSTLLASEFNTDFALLELSQQPAEASNVYYAGWDARGDTPQSVVSIHHPNGDEKAIAIEGDALVSTDIGRGGETHWQITTWDAGITEPGSSGSCIFDQTTKNCLGILTGGTAACTVLDGFDVYGKLSLAWTGAGTDTTRLSNWLDPVGGGINTSLDGTNPGDGGGGGGGGNNPGACTPDTNTLCLHNGRFQVTSTWRDFGGNTGNSIVSPAGTDYSGIFWFFAEMNSEVLVKVLDGCGVNDHFWVFSAAATNVEFSITVTDLDTDESKTYSNPMGNAAQSVVDTAAFATCP